MTLKAFYHILLINNWQSIVKEQINEMFKSGLLDELDSFYIGAIGDYKELDKLRKILPDKAEIVRYAEDPKHYEFFTLAIAWHEANKPENFYGLYFHTKGVTNPSNHAGEHWRHYMNDYNLTKYKEAIRQLRKNYDTCGVKMNTDSRFPDHYSGNFYWFKSSYVRRLPDPESIDMNNRYNAEFWIGREKPKMASLCQDFVDYNTKGKYKIGTNYVHTLCWNLPSEVEKVTKKLYELNDSSQFKHIIVDLGFPLVNDPVYNVEDNKKHNTKELIRIAKKYGSTYVKMENVGVSQNWTQVYKYLNMEPEDVLIGQDPDEHPQSQDWIIAMADVIREGYSMTALMMTDHKPLLHGRKTQNVAGRRVLSNVKGINWALIGFSGAVLDKMGGVPVPNSADTYGWIENAVREQFAKHNENYAVLTDYTVRHTDYELGDDGTSDVLRKWKNYIIFEQRGGKQMSLEEFITTKL